MMLRLVVLVWLMYQQVLGVQNQEGSKVHGILSSDFLLKGPKYPNQETERHQNINRKQINNIDTSTLINWHQEKNNGMPNFVHIYYVCLGNDSRFLQSLLSDVPQPLYLPPNPLSYPLQMDDNSSTIQSLYTNHPESNYNFFNLQNDNPNRVSLNLLPPVRNLEETTPYQSKITPNYLPDLQTNPYMYLSPQTSPPFPNLDYTSAEMYTNEELSNDISISPTCCIQSRRRPIPGPCLPQSTSSLPPKTSCDRTFPILSLKPIPESSPSQTSTVLDQIKYNIVPEYIPSKYFQTQTQMSPDYTYNNPYYFYQR